MEVLLSVRPTPLFFDDSRDGWREGYSDEEGWVVSCFCPIMLEVFLVDLGVLVANFIGTSKAERLMLLGVALLLRTPPASLLSGFSSGRFWK